MITILFYCLIQLGMAFLTKPQLYTVCNILKNNNTSLSIKEKTQFILFDHSKPFVIKKHYTFVNNSRVASQFHPTKKQLLLHYGYMGLWKAVRNYNGKSNFYNYASIYIDGELKKGLTDIFGSSIMPHRFRVNKEFRSKNKELYSKSFVTPMSFNTKRLPLNIKNIYNIELDHLYDIINSLNHKDKLYFKYKYDIYTGKPHRSTKHVAELMCVSEEKARRELSKICNNITNQIKIFNELYE